MTCCGINASCKSKFDLSRLCTAAATGEGDGGGATRSLRSSGRRGGRMKLLAADVMGEVGIQAWNDTGLGYLVYIKKLN